MRLNAISNLKNGGKPVYLCASAPQAGLVGERAARFAAAAGFDGSRTTLLLVPDAGGAIECALMGLGREATPMDAGRLARQLPEGDWRIEGDVEDPALAALSFVLASYSFDRYRKKHKQKARLVLPEFVDGTAIRQQARGGVPGARSHQHADQRHGPGRNSKTPSARSPRSHKADVDSVVGDDLLKRNFPMIHAVGRASASAPRLIDMTWGNRGAPEGDAGRQGRLLRFRRPRHQARRFGMLLMKKDMGGAANVLALAQMIMAAKLPVRLRADRAGGRERHFRQCLPPRRRAAKPQGHHGRDRQYRRGRPADPWRCAGLARRGSARADDRHGDADRGRARGARPRPAAASSPTTTRSRASLPAPRQGCAIRCGACRCGRATGKGSPRRSPTFHNIGKGGFGGAITAALFLQRFVEKARSWAHLDIYAWVNAEKPHAPVGGDAQGIRAIYSRNRGTASSADLEALSAIG